MKKVKYDQYRHLPLKEASRLTGLEEDVLRGYFSASRLPVYESGHEADHFVDRLDLGRVTYSANGKNGVNGRRKGRGLTIDRYFTDGKSDPFDAAGPYEERQVEIRHGDRVVFSMNATFPKSWPDVSAKVTASKYFFKPDKEEWAEKIEGGYEHDPRQLFDRVARFFGEEGWKQGYFRTKVDQKAFEDELRYLQITRKGAFNSPVYFNAGIYTKYGITGSPGLNYARDPKTGRVRKIEDGCYVKPQCHACFIIGPEDNLESLAEHVKTQFGIFSHGSGEGHDLSDVRAEREVLSSGGFASGPLSFFEIYDKVASAIKSGGKTRRAARMTTIRQHHPDVLKFVRAKVSADKKALTLIRAGYSPGFEGEAYTTVPFQNTNISIRLDDYFFEQIEKGGEIELKEVVSGKVAGKISADRLLKEISFGSWRVGDPGVQYESQIQRYHTCKNSGRINSSNPCSEYMFLDKTSCNLASLNLLEFADERGKVDITGVKRAARIFYIAQDIANDAGSYPNEIITRVSPEFRTIGLGYANLGSLLMRNGMPYDSEQGRALAAALTTIVCGTAYETSVELAKELGPFVHFELNKEPMVEVMRLHQKNLDDIVWDLVSKDGDYADKLKKAAYECWNNVVSKGREVGLRNAQATVLAPTGTIALMMGCNTTGVEPSIGLVVTKSIAGGGLIDLIDQEVPNALKNLGYNERQVGEVVDYIMKNKSVEGAPHLSPNHYLVFDTAFAATRNGRSIPFEGHVGMLGAVQPFISGAVSKTNNLPERASVKDIYDGYVLGNKLGLKALAVFRDNGKPVSVLKIGDAQENPFVEYKRGEKRELPKKRNAPEFEVKIGETPFHIFVSEYEDGTPGQVLIASYKSGSTMKALLTAHGIDVSTALKYGVPLEKIVGKHIGEEFEPKGITDHEYIRVTKSPIDLVHRLLAVEYLGLTEYANAPVDITKLQGFKNGAFRAFARRKIDDWDYEQVINDPELGGFVKADEKPAGTAVKAAEEAADNDGKNGYGLEDKVKRGIKQGVPCPKCGNMMMQVKPGCYECDCGENRGGCSG